LIGLDSNVLLRYIMQDDPAQSARAARLVESLTVDNPGFICLISLAELYWVLDHSYKLSASQIAEVFERILTTETLVLEEDLRVQRALERYRSGNADFDDCLIAETASAHQCSSLLTFDKKAAKSGLMQLLS
jgi:predicted nucleic-acid-binding protein